MTGVFALAAASIVLADVPNRVAVRGTVPNPGTQQQELPNITFPSPYNTFEFVVTCAACHGGQVDQQVAHMGNWGGTAMASAARDPVFRANQIIVNEKVKQLTGEDGAGNMCFRCHSPNGWTSGRFDPVLNGAANGSQMLHSIIMSTDDEGVSCESCHRTMNAVTFKRADLVALEGQQGVMDSVWNMMATISDWPHQGMPYVDQDGDPTLGAGNPYGDGTLQFDEGMTYIGRYPGTADIYYKDLPLLVDPLGVGGFSPGGPYTGQTYGVYPPGWIDMLGNDVGGQVAMGPDGVSPLLQLDIPIGPPLNPNGTPNYQAQSVSPEHSTVKHPNLAPLKGYIQTSEFCGSCHELTIPVLNHGMPEQRTYSEWKYSAYGDPNGPDYRTCQDCHMPRLSHEYTDDILGSYNADPLGEPGGWPYSKPRTNTAVHKFAGANRDLPEMMKLIYPEVDFEVVGGAGIEGGGNMGMGTGNDPRIFPGMLSTRDSLWERNRRNTDVNLMDGVDVSIVGGPTLVDALAGKWQVQVRVTNLTGHRLPSGYPDGRRMWLGLQVTDATGALQVPFYESGWYDDATATLFTDGNRSAFRRALGNQIDASVAGGNAVMTYERVTGACSFDPVTGERVGCTPSLDLLNDHILFDNRIPPAGFSYGAYRATGVKFWTYDPATFVPVEDATRYPDGQGFDVVTYTFLAPPDAQLAVRAELFFQSHTREFMEHLRASDQSLVRPQGPPRPWALNYPLAPNYISDEFDLVGAALEAQAAGFLGVGEALNDNWGGVAYAAWFKSGKGAPFSMGAAGTVGAVALAPPAQVANLHVYPEWTVDANGKPVPIGGIPMEVPGAAPFIEPFTQVLTWDAIPGADGYLVRIKYGLPGTTTASWDKLAIVPKNAPPCTADVPAPCLINTAINVNKTYTYSIQAFNAGGYGPESAPVSGKTPWDIPLEPLNLACSAIGDTFVTLTWFDQADNELGFRVESSLVPVGPSPPPATWTFVADVPSPGVPTFGSFSYRVTGLLPGRTYNWQVGAYNNSGLLYSLPATCTTTGTPVPAAGLTATFVSAAQVDLEWIDQSGSEAGFRVQRAADVSFTTFVEWSVPMNTTRFTDVGVQPATAYFYRVVSFNANGDAAPSNIVEVTTPDVPPGSPTTLLGTSSAPGVRPVTVSLTWTDNATNETGFELQRSLDPAFPAAGTVTFTLAANTTSFVDDTVEPVQTYHYRLRAFNALGFSGFAQTSVTTSGEIPQAPSNLAVDRVAGTSVQLSWRDNSTNETGFRLERTNGGATPVYFTVPAGVTTYRDTAVARRTLYTYRVQAFNGDGASAWSAPVSATTR
ncbi:MAG TPA: fibronectin type III domain-containing protein [Anaeromyxobacter sp.]|nr:fibronectin type III domain-containing protein [Anaeromyxobacter sp.]